MGEEEMDYRWSIRESSCSGLRTTELARELTSIWATAGTSGEEELGCADGGGGTSGGGIGVVLDCIIPNDGDEEWIE